MDDEDGSDYGDEPMELEEEVRLERGDPEDEEMETELSNVPAATLALDILNDETTRLAAGLASQDGDLLAAIAAMQKAVTGKDGENVLVSYVLASPQCVELMNIWQAGSGSATAVPLMQLLYHMFRHTLGKVDGYVVNRDSDSQRRFMIVNLRLDKLARSIVRNRMKDIYSHLSSSQRSRQNAGLLLLSAMVLRGRTLGTEIATTFDFTLEALKKLARSSKNQKSDFQHDMMFKRPTRYALVEFAMSFLEVGDPGLLRWILQKRPLYAGVLHGISKDPETMMVKVLVLLQEKVMDPQFMVPRGLQSVLFGDATLEQLARISADKTLELANEFAHDILLELCTDPSHGLCPESTEVWEAQPGQTGAFGGGQARLLRLMNRLKVTEVDKHRDLLLATGRARPKFAAAYLASIPLSLEPRVSRVWFKAMSLVAVLIPLASQTSPFASLVGQGLTAPPHDGPLIRSAILSLLPASLSRLALNRGLQHADIMVKHACLRVLYEALMALKRLLESLDVAAAAAATYSEPIRGPPGISCTAMEINVTAERESRGEPQKEQWLKLSHSIQDTMRAYLPDPNVLFGILPSLKTSLVSTKIGVASLSDEGAQVSVKKRKRTDLGTADGSNEQQIALIDNYDYEATIIELWGSDAIVDAGRRESSEVLLHSKVVEVLASFQTVLPIALADTGFDAFKLLPENPVAMPVVQQKALTSLLLAVTGSSSTSSSEKAVRFVGEFAGVGSAHKRLKPLLLLMLSTDLKDVSEAAYLIIHRIMVSTGAFGMNLGEVRLWLDALVGWKFDKFQEPQATGERTELDLRNNLTSDTVHGSLIDFLAEAVGSISQSIYKYLERLHSTLSTLMLESDVGHTTSIDMVSKDVYVPEFGPFVICSLETCFRSAKSKTVPQRAAIATYVANALYMLLKYQVHPQALAAVVSTELSTGFTTYAQQLKETANLQLFEWSSLYFLLQQSAQLLPSCDIAQISGSSRLNGVDQAQNPDEEKLLAVLKACKRQKDVAIETRLETVRSVLLTTPVKEVVETFPLLMRVCADIFNGDSSTLVALLGVHQSLLSDVSTAWPELFALAMEQAGAIKDMDGETVDIIDPTASTLKSVHSSKGSEAVGLCSLLLRCPFPVLFSAAVYGNNGMLLRNHAFTQILLRSSSKVSHSSWLHAVRLVVSGVKHVVGIPTEGASPLDVCFSLLCSLISPTHLKSVGDHLTSLAGADDGDTMRDYQNMIIDLLHHPALYTYFLDSNILSTASCPLVSGLRRDNKDEKLCDTSLRRVLASAASSVNAFDGHILVLLTRLLESIQTLGESAIFLPLVDQVRTLQDLVFEACGSFVRKAVSIFRKEMEENLSVGVVASPSLFAVSVLIPYADVPSTVDFLLSLLLVGSNKFKKSKQAVAPHVLGLHLATVFIDSLSEVSGRQRFQTGHPESWNCGHQFAEESDSQLIFDLFERVLEQVISFPSVMADLCLLSFLQALDPKSAVSKRSEEFYLRFDKTRFADLARCTPLAVLRHCVMHPNKVTGTIAKLLVESSSVHLSEFGRLIVHGTANKNQSILSGLRLSFADRMLVSCEKTQSLDLALSDEDLFSLLPAVKVYFDVKSVKGRDEDKEVVTHIAGVYGRYLSKLLKSWDELVAKEAVVEWYVSNRSPGTLSGAYFHSSGSMDDYCSYSPLGQVVRILEHCQSFDPRSNKKRDRVFKSLLSEENSSLIPFSIPKSADEDTRQMVCEAVAKVHILRHLLDSSSKVEFSDREESQSIVKDKVKSVDGAKLDGRNDNMAIQRFLSCLVYTLGALFKSGGMDRKEESASVSSVLQAGPKRGHWLLFLEQFLLLQVIQTAEQLLELSVDLSSYIPMYRYSLATLLGYRYGIPSAMKAARYLTMVYLDCLQVKNVEGQTVDVNALELLISHSRFLPSMLAWNPKRMQIPHLSGKHAGKGTALNSLTSVLLLVGSPLVDHVEEEGIESSDEPAASLDVTVKMQPQNQLKDVRSDEEDQKKMELVKLLRVFVALRLKQCNLDMTSSESVPLEQILSVLLAAYGGTMSELDQELLTLMHEIESQGGPGFSGLSGLDYLWGEAALKRRKSKSAQLLSLKSGLDEADGLSEIRRQTFKEDLVIDPRRCGLTVLFFPPRRPVDVPGVGQFQTAKQFLDGCKEVRGRGMVAVERELRAAAYDPAFLLPFSVHGLSIGCISAEEFVRLGLLAVAFASISSANESMRKAGYEVLAKYYTVLEGCPSFKGRTQVRLLMTYVKNSVADAWQKLPLVLSVFAAEASCILMNPENHHYLTINRFLLRAPNLDMESIPLFQIMFGSGSVQYRSDRLWMLRLLAAGLGSSVDAHIYRRKFVLELLMSFHDSAMADRFTRKWVLQVLYQAANVRSCSLYLVEHTGLLSWLASVAVNDCLSQSGSDGKGTEGELASVSLKVIESIMSWGVVQSHLLTDGTEELSKVALMFHRFLVRNSTSHYQKIFARPTIKVMISVLRMSHRRKKHQTHFTLNIVGLQEVINWIEGGAMPLKFVGEMELRTSALEMILHSSPPQVTSIQDKVGFYNIASWAVQVAQQSDLENSVASNIMTVKSSQQGKAGLHESLTQKLLRWLAAALVLGGISRVSETADSNMKLTTCLSVVSALKKVESLHGVVGLPIDRKLARLLLSLQGHVKLQTEAPSLVTVIAAVTTLTPFTGFSIKDDDGFQTSGEKISSVLELLLTELPCPEEINPSWLWSFSGPWSTHGNSSPGENAAVEVRYVSEVCSTIFTFLQLLWSKRPASFASCLINMEARITDPFIFTTRDDDSSRDKILKKLALLQENFCRALQRRPLEVEECNKYH